MGDANIKTASEPRAKERARISLPSDREIRIIRRFDAPCKAVFEAWTRPEHVTHWWDPSGLRLAACEIDLRPGGVFRFVHQSERGAGHAFTGKYREVTPPSRLVFVTEMPPGTESTGTLLFEEHGGQTVLTLTIESPSREVRDGLLRMQVDQGTALTLDNLDRYLGKLYPGA